MRSACPDSRRPASGTAAVLLLVPLAMQSSGALRERGARLEAAVPAWLREAQVPGASLALADRDGVVWSHAFGVRDAESGAPAGVDTLFGAASLTKVAVAYAALRLVHEGVLELDRPLVRYGPLEDLAHDPRHALLTARHVLGHTTGLPNWRPRGGRLEFLADPGARYGYSGEGFVLLGKILEGVSGRTLSALVEEHVFRPLGMQHSFLACPAVASDIARPHDQRGNAKPLPKGEVNAAASLYTTASDFALLLVALLRGEGLDERLARELATPQVAVREGVGWGLGLGTEEQPDGPALWQWGHNDGYRAYATLHPARGTAFVYLSDGDGGMLPLAAMLRMATGIEDHPALEQMGYESLDSPRRALRLALEAALERGGMEVLTAALAASAPGALDEGVLNTLGYSLLHGEPPRVGDAVGVFRLNVARFPAYANGWDSLGEGLRVAGELDAALAAYQRSVALDPGSGGRAAIEELRAELARREPASEEESMARAIGEYLERWQQRGELSGVVLAARGEHVLFRRAYGLADVERRIPNTPETVFQVASVTKTFTAAAVLSLQDAGQLALSDPLARFMPDYPRGDEITLEHCLSHSSGIPDHHGLPGFAEKTAHGISLAELVRWQSTFPLLYDPGTSEGYVNSGFAVLARVVELVSGEPFPDFVRANLLQPLGMRSTGETGAEAGALVARGYSFGPPPDFRIPVPARDWSYAMGSGSMRSTADDLLAWLRAVAARTLFDVGRTRWPYGWGKQSYAGHQALEQTGMHDGFTATISVVPEDQIYVVHLSNLQAGLPFQRVHRDVVRLLLGLEVERPEEITPASWDPGAGKGLAGTYDAGQDSRPSLVADEKGLWWSWNAAQAPGYLLPIGAGRYLLVSDGCELRFDSPAPDGAPRFELHEPWKPDGPIRTYVRTGPAAR